MGTRLAPSLFTSPSVNAANFSLGTKPSGYTYDLSASAGTLTLTVKPGTPAGLAATASASGATLNWTAATGAVSYKVKRSTISGSGFGTIITSGASVTEGSGPTPTVEAHDLYDVGDAAHPKRFMRLQAW